MEFMIPGGLATSVNPAWAIVSSALCAPVKTEASAPFLLLLVLSSVHASFDSTHLENLFYGQLAAALTARGLFPEVVQLQVIHCPPDTTTWGGLRATYFPAVMMSVPDELCRTSHNPCRRSFPHLGSCVLCYTGSVDRPQFPLHFVLRHVRKFDDTAFLRAPTFATDATLAGAARLTWTPATSVQDTHHHYQMKQLLRRKAALRHNVDFFLSKPQQQLPVGKLGCLSCDRSGGPSESGLCIDVEDGKGSTERVDLPKVDAWIERSIGGFGVHEVGPEEFTKLFRNVEGLFIVLLVTDLPWQSTTCAARFHKLGYWVRRKQQSWRFAALAADRYRPFVVSLGFVFPETPGQYPLLVFTSDRSSFDLVPFADWFDIKPSQFVRVSKSWMNRLGRSKWASFLAASGDGPNSPHEPVGAAPGFQSFQAADIGSDAVRNIEFPMEKRRVPVLLFVHAPFCGFSQSMRAVLVDVRQTLVAKGVSMEEELLFVEHLASLGHVLPASLESLVEGYPTLMVLERDSNITSLYDGPRSLARIASFALQHRRASSEFDDQGGPVPSN